jgi:hypothetical protein
MAYLNTIGCGEGLSSSRPPLFDGTNFATWKTRFRIYARSQGVKVWMAIEDGVVIPTKTVEDVTIEKKVSEYTHEEENMMNIAAKAEMVLTSALAEKEYKRVNNCKSAQEMWNKLVVTYEGTIDIKDSRMDTLIQEYENFKLQDGENIIDMETRFTRIIDELSQLGKSYTRNEKNRRVLKSLPPSWKVKVTTIKEMHNLNDYDIDSLFGNLRAYEEDNVPDKVIPKVEDKKKSMALKAILIDENDNDEELNEELQNLDESEIALLTRQLRRVLQSKAQRYGKGFLKTNNQQRVFNSNGRPNYSQNYTPNYKSNFPSTGFNKSKGTQNTNAYNNANNNNNPPYTPPKHKEQNVEETQEVCFECKQPGHYKRECPKLSKGRILVAENGWDLSEDEEAPEASEEVVNLCLMAIGDDVASTQGSTSNQEVSLNYISNKLHLDESNLNLVDMSKYDLIELVVGINNKYEDADRKRRLLWSEKMKLEEIHHTQSKEFTRMMDSETKYEDEITSLKDQNNRLKIEVNNFKDNILNLEVENISLVLQAEEMENEKVQLNDNISKLHVDLLNLKILNESIVRDNNTSQSQENTLENENELIQAFELKEKELQSETQRLKEENFKLMAQVEDQEKFLNIKIDALEKEKENLEIVIQRFTKGNEILDKMVHSKISYNREGLGYDKNSPPKREVQTRKQPQIIPPKPQSLACSFCNKNGHSIQECKFKSGEIKGKHVWVRKGTKPYKKVERHVPFNKVTYKGQQQQRPLHSTMFQNRNSKYHNNDSRQASRNQHVSTHNFYPRNAPYYPNVRNDRFQNNVRMNASRNLYYNPYLTNDRNVQHANSRVYNNVRHTQHHVNAPRNIYMSNNDYPMPRFYHAHSNVMYDVLTPGPSRQKGTYKYN